jgi:hypothetical protein
LRTRILVAGAAALLLAAGCATQTGTGADSASDLIGDVTVRIDPGRLAPGAQDLSRVAKVEISDIRQTVHSERTTIGGISLGRIVIQPGEAEVVRALVQAKADAVLARLGRRAVQTIYCGIRAFQVETPATPVYWDVTTRIELVLRVGEQDRAASGTKTERTYLWPTQALVQSVTNEALRRVAAETEQALTELLAAR